MMPENSYLKFRQPVFTRLQICTPHILRKSSRQFAEPQKTLPTATHLCPTASSFRRENRKSARPAVAGTTPYKIICPGREVCDLNLPHPGQTKSLTRLRHPLPSDGRGTRRRIVLRLTEIRATGFAGRPSANRETDSGHFLSWGRG